MLRFGRLDSDGISGSPPGEGSLPLFHIVVIALVQGISEFLPISASGQMAPFLAGWPGQGPGIGLATDIGALFAAVAYFWRDCARIIIGLGRLIAGRRDSNAGLARSVLFAAPPALAIGCVAPYVLGEGIGSIRLTGWMMIGFALVLYAADRFGSRLRQLDQLSAGQALVIGLAQSLAFLPGTGRAGLAMAAARLQGVERREAVRLSVLLSIPASLAAGLVQAAGALRSATLEPLADLALITGLSALAGFVAIAFLMRWVNGRSLTIFVVYRLLFGAALLYIIYVRGF
jgi:undecaprenyl-diphosphatase